MFWQSQIILHLKLPTYMVPSSRTSSWNAIFGIRPSLQVSPICKRSTKFPYWLPYVHFGRDGLMAEENPFEIWNFIYRWHHIRYIILISATSWNNDKIYNLKVFQKFLDSCKKYLLRFGSITCWINFHYFIFYVYVLSCTWNQSR